jgi:hypothetical protein
VPQFVKAEGRFMAGTSIPVRQWQEVLQLLREAQHRSDEHAKATHARFNVFTTLLAPNDEVRLHTRFLHCLLNPKGAHDCGPLFLRLFFETLRDANLSPLDDDDKPSSINFPLAGQWEAEKEFAISRKRVSPHF